MRHGTNLVKVIAFVVITGLLSAFVVMTLSHGSLEPRTRYHAIFDDVSGMSVGSEVRAAGVSVGTVADMEMVDGGWVDVTFSANSTVPLTSSTTATIRWADLTGSRYLDLTDDGGGARRAAGSTIPVEFTRPALDLDSVFGGFQPLMQALSPQEVNDLTGSIIAVTEGQSGAVDGLLEHVASLTNELGRRDELIGSVISNLADVLATVDEHGDDLDQLITGLSQLMHGVAHDRVAIGRSLEQINGFESRAARLLAVLRPELAGTLTQARKVAANINSDSAYVNRILGELPGAISSLGRGGAYGAFFNFYLCGLRMKFSGPDGNAVYSPWQVSKESRCEY